MIKTEFGIIDKFDREKDYSEYEPQKYNCISIDDEAYIDGWWPQLCEMKTFFHRMSRPSTALARCGVTIIPPSSLPVFQQIVLSDSRITTDIHLIELANMIQKAIETDKHMIHYGI